MATDLRVLTNTDRGFYPLLGPFLARREVVAEVGGTVWDEDTKTWFVACRGGTVLGFVSVAPRAGRLFVESLYLPAGADVDARRVVAAAVERFGAQVLQAKVRRTPERLGPYLAAGFVEVESGSTANYAHLTREPKP